MAAGPMAGRFPRPGLSLVLRLFPAADAPAPGSRKRLHPTGVRLWWGGSAPLAWLCTLQGAAAFLDRQETGADHRLDALPNPYPKGGT